MRKRLMAHERAGLRNSAVKQLATALVCVLACGQSTYAVDVESFSFTVGAIQFTVYFQPLKYLDAVASCANHGATLIPFQLVPDVFAELLATQPGNAAALIQNIMTVTETQTSGQNEWNLWTWDQYRACRGLNYYIASPAITPQQFFLTSDRPCYWKLLYVCMPESSQQSGGMTSASAWWRQFYAPGAPSAPPPSPFALGAAGSGLALVRSGRVYGDPSPPAGLTVAFDNSGDFWRDGPVVSAFFRATSFKLVSLRLLREAAANTSLVWSWYRNQTQIAGGIIGADGSTVAPVGPLQYEVYNVGPFNDYIVTVQGCYRAAELELLFFVSRSGRQYQMGRGGCTVWFREDAPPGGYLAGLAGAHVNSALGPRSLGPGQSVVDVVWINQVQLVWAASDAAARPVTYGVQPSPSPPIPAAFPAPPSPLPPSASSSTSTSAFSWAASGAGSCPGALPLARVLYGRGGGVPATCGADSGGSGLRLVCPSNTCCGGFWQLPQSNTSFWICNSTSQACQTNCQRGFGLCSSTLPDRPVLQFVRSPPLRLPDAAAAAASGRAAAAAAVVSSSLPAGDTDAAGVAMVYIMKNDGLALSYPEAQAYCRKSYMGMSWSLVNASDVLGWYTSMDTRRAAYVAIASLGYFWVSVSDAASQRDACSRAGYAVPTGSDTYLHHFVPSACNATTAVVVCKRAAADSSGSTLLAAGTGTGAGAGASASSSSSSSSSLRWSPGFHQLTTSRSLGGGPYGDNSCPFALGATPAATATAATANTSANTNTTSASASASSSASPASQITSIAVAIATQLSNDTDSVAVVAALRLVPYDGGDAAAAAAAGASWSELALDAAAGEVVVAVSGCVGGFVERLVFHTSSGRLWTPPFTVASICTAPFEERAPAGSYLVGMQGYLGDYLESLQLVWGQPPAAAAASDLRSETNGRTVGIAVGVSVGGAAALALLGLLSVALWRRRQHQQQQTQEKQPGLSDTSASGGAANGKVPHLAAAAASEDGASARNGDKAGKGAAAADMAVTAAALTYGGDEPTEPVLQIVLRGGGGGEGGGGGGDGDGAGASEGKAGEGSSPAATTIPRTGTGTGTGTTPAASCGEMASPITTGSTSQRTADIEKSLSAYGRSRAGADGGGAGSSGAGQAGDKTHKTDIVTAISRLQEELCGRQEQLQVTTLLGKGSFGVVYRGTWRGLQVAVKELLVHDALLGRQGRRRQQAILEAAISKAMQHPNVVVTYATEVVQLAAASTASCSPAAATSSSDVALLTPTTTATATAADGLAPSCATPGAIRAPGDVYKLYIIQEYCEFGSLSAALASGVVGSVSAGGAAALCALTLALDVACGMCHIHAKNIVHGDLSAGNVLLASCRRTGSGAPEQPYDGAAESAVLRQLSALWRPPVVAKVSDFGLSVHMSDSQTHASNRFQGTLAYIAPEVRERGHLSKAADVWAFGVLLLELLHGASMQQQQQHIRDAAAAAAATSAAAAAAAECPVSCPSTGTTPPPPPSPAVCAAAPAPAPLVAPAPAPAAVAAMKPAAVDAQAAAAVVVVAVKEAQQAGAEAGAEAEPAAAAAVDWSPLLSAAVGSGAPRQLVELVGACLAQEPRARPAFGEAVEVLSRVLLQEHHRTARHMQQQQQQQQGRQQPILPHPAAAAAALRE